MIMKSKHKYKLTAPGIVVSTDYLSMIVLTMLRVSSNLDDVKIKSNGQVMNGHQLQCLIENCSDDTLKYCVDEYFNTK